MIKKILAWTSIFIWSGVIFQFSAQNAEESSTLSQGLSKVLYQMISSLPGIKFEISFFHSLLRKSAHFLIFFILALLLLNAFRISGFDFNYSALYTIIIAVIYAALDEYHQSFIPGRAAELRDVLIDSLGIFSAVGIYRLVLLFLGFS